MSVAGQKCHESMLHQDWMSELPVGHYRSGQSIAAYAQDAAAWEGFGEGAWAGDATLDGAEAEEGEALSSPPPPPELCRDVTDDGFESPQVLGIFPVVTAYQLASLPVWTPPESSTLALFGGRAAAEGLASAEEGESPVFAPPPSPEIRGPGEVDAVAVAEVMETRRAQTLEAEFWETPCGGVFRIWWIVDARKLKSSDREAVSPPFQLILPRALRPVQFKMILRPSSMHVARGGSSFKKARGRGSIQVRCLEQLELEDTPDQGITLSLAVGSLKTKGAPTWGPLQHKFSERTTLGPEHTLREWDFAQQVDRQSQTFDVCLEILAGITGVQIAQMHA